MNLVKKSILLPVIAISIIISMVACSNQSWSVKNDKHSLSMGTYIYFLSMAYAEASGKLGVNPYSSSPTSKDSSIINKTIDDKKASDWIKDRAVEECKTMIAIYQKMDEIGLSLAEEEINKAQEHTDQSWVQYASIFNKLGISKESFHKTAILLPLQKKALFKAIYGKEGTNAVSDEQLQEYYKENNASVSIITKSLIKTMKKDKDNEDPASSEGSESSKNTESSQSSEASESSKNTESSKSPETSESSKNTESSKSSEASESSENVEGSENQEKGENLDTENDEDIYDDYSDLDFNSSQEKLTDEEIEEVKNKFESYANDINSKSKTMDEVGKTYKSENDLSTDPVEKSTVSFEHSSYSEEVINAIKDLDVDKAIAINSNDKYYLIQRNDIADKLEKLNEETTRDSVLYSMKFKDFEKMIDEMTKDLEFKINKMGINKHNPSIFEKRKK